ncbi:MAG: aspartyl protease family protein [Lewinellaceae bacterium]|nr:aspartyl protease family protein [Phaeodactylibacter sp.]MCB9039594.1 aspartyl protease family protein [Lewinellaceae bacterium]
MRKKPALLLLLTLLFAQCTSVKKLLRQGEVIKAGISQPIEFEYQNRLLFVDVRVNGLPRRFIIDSGAPTVVSQELREELQLKRVKSTQVSDSQNNRSKLEFVRLESLAFGGVEIAHSAALATDLSLFHCLGIDGLLGANAMSHFDWEVDYQEETIGLYRKGGAGQPEASYKIAIPFTTNAQGTPDLEIGIPGRLSTSGLTLDLGSTRGISIRKTDKLNIRQDSASTFSYGRTSKGIFGANTDTTWYFQVDSLLIGDALFGPTVITSFNTSNKIGNRFWENYKLLISWSSQRLYLSPRNATSPQLPPELLKIGYEDGAVRILTVYQKLAQANDRIEPGDEVTAINGASTEGISLEEYCALREGVWEELQLKARGKESGEIMEITLNRDELEW